MEAISRIEVPKTNDVTPFEALAKRYAELDNKDKTPNDIMAKLAKLDALFDDEAGIRITHTGQKTSYESNDSWGTRSSMMHFYSLEVSIPGESARDMKRVGAVGDWNFSGDVVKKLRSAGYIDPERPIGEYGYTLAQRVEIFDIVLHNHVLPLFKLLEDKYGESDDVPEAIGIVREAVEIVRNRNSRELSERLATQRTAYIAEAKKTYDEVQLLMYELKPLLGSGDYSGFEGVSDLHHLVEKLNLDLKYASGIDKGTLPVDYNLDTVDPDDPNYVEFKRRWGKEIKGEEAIQRIKEITSAFTEYKNHAEQGDDVNYTHETNRDRGKGNYRFAIIEPDGSIQEPNQQLKDGRSVQYDVVPRENAKVEFQIELHGGQNPGESFAIYVDINSRNLTDEQLSSISKYLLEENNFNRGFVEGISKYGLSRGMIITKLKGKLVSLPDPSAQDYLGLHLGLAAFLPKDNQNIEWGREDRIYYSRYENPFEGRGGYWDSFTPHFGKTEEESGEVEVVDDVLIDVKQTDYEPAVTAKTKKYLTFVDKYIGSTLEEIFALQQDKGDSRKSEIATMLLAAQLPVEQLRDRISEEDLMAALSRLKKLESDTAKDEGLSQQVQDLARPVEIVQLLFDPEITQEIIEWVGEDSENVTKMLKLLKDNLSSQDEIPTVENVKESIPELADQVS